MVTGSWVVKRVDHDGDFWLLGGPNDKGSIRTWFSWGGAESANVYPTKTAARHALRGYRRRTRSEEIVIERSYGHEGNIR